MKHAITITRKGLALTATALVSAAVILVSVILPAEFGIDPLGLGRITKTISLYHPRVNVVDTNAAAETARNHSIPWRSDVVDIPLASYVDGGVSELEYKVSMIQGDILLYSWDAIRENGTAVASTEVYSEFHGQTPDDAHKLAPGEHMTVAYYFKSFGSSDNGTLTAPFTGIHGWFLQNQSDTPLTIRLRLAGYYRLVSPGNPGNEFGLVANHSPAT